MDYFHLTYGTVHLGPRPCHQSTEFRYEVAGGVREYWLQEKVEDKQAEQFWSSLGRITVAT